MSVYTPPALNAVDFDLTVQPAHSVVPAETVLSVYTIPALTAVDFALTTYAPPVYNRINFELLPGGGTTYTDAGKAVGILVGSGFDRLDLADLGRATGEWVGSGTDEYVIVVTYDDAGKATGILTGSGLDEYGIIGGALPPGGARWTEQDWKKYRRELEEQSERYEMRLSEELSKRLEESQQREVAALKISKMLMDTNAFLSETINTIQEKAVVVPPKPPMDAAKKAVLMDRLEMARISKEQKKQEREAFEQQRLKNLAKARKVAKKNRG